MARLVREGDDAPSPQQGRALLMGPVHQGHGLREEGCAGGARLDVLVREGSSFSVGRPRGSTSAIIVYVVGRSYRVLPLWVFLYGSCNLSVIHGPQCDVDRSEK
jgi:hypothetical protein